MSNNVNINGATDRTSIKCHKIYKDNRKSFNKRLWRLSLSGWYETCYGVFL